MTNQRLFLKKTGLRLYFIYFISEADESDSLNQGAFSGVLERFSKSDKSKPSQPFYVVT